MRKSSPSFCQDTPDKESRRHCEVVMIVLTDGKDASIAYCLTTALYCPLPGQYLAIARHKTIRRERKSPLSFLLFTLHQIAWNPDKHWGSERWRVAHHSSPLFTHSSPGYFFIGLRWINRAFLLHGLRTDSVRRLSSVRRPSGFAIRCKKMFDLWNRGICNPPSINKQLAKNLEWRVVKSRAHSSPYQNNLYTNTYATSMKGEEYFWKWRIIVTSYSGLQIRKEKVEHFLTADCKS